jgi:hypothetical protein
MRSRKRCSTAGWAPTGRSWCSPATPSSTWCCLSARTPPASPSRRSAPPTRCCALARATSGIAPDAVAGPADIGRAVVVLTPRAYRPPPPLGRRRHRRPGADRHAAEPRRDLDPAPPPPARHRRPPGRPPHRRRRHRRRPRPRRRERTVGLGRLRRRARPRPRLNPSLRRIGQPPRLPARPRDPIHRLRRLRGHGSPRTCTSACSAHLHVSWGSPCYGTSELSPPCTRVMAFPAPP